MVDKIKVVMLGDQGAGKTSLVMRYVYDNFYNDYQGTIGIDFLSVNHTAQGRTDRVQIWDTAGQERFRSLIPSYVRDSRLALVIFDVCCEKSFENAQWWIDMVKRERNIDNIVVGLIGNKIDKEDCRVVSSSDAREMAKTNSVFYRETSAKTGHKVKGVFTDAIGMYLEKNGGGDYVESSLVEIQLDKGEKGGSAASCCVIL